MQAKIWPMGLLRTTPPAMGQMSTSVEVCVGLQGRMVIPAPLRRSLGLKEGDQLVARNA
jgi:AbrB family looped-hinge helix DNA binding protein